MKFKSLSEIDENYNSLLEEELKKLHTRFGTFSGEAENKKYEKEFKERLNYLLKKREEQISTFLKKHRDTLFESEKKEEKKKKEKKKVLDVKHLDLELSLKDKAEIRKKIFLFKWRLRISNFYYSVIPSFVFYHFFRTRYIFKLVFQEFFRRWNYFWKRVGVRFSKIGKKIAAFFKGVYEKVISLAKSAGKGLVVGFKKLSEFVKKLLAKVKKDKEGEEGSSEESSEEGSPEGEKNASEGEEKVSEEGENSSGEEEKSESKEGEGEDKEKKEGEGEDEGKQTQ